MDQISKLLRPQSVAVIGASADPNKTAGRPIAYLQKMGFNGSIFPVNPKNNEINGLRSYPDITSLPATPDVGVVLLGADRAHLAVRDLAQKGCSAAIVLASGYAETGEEGVARQSELLSAAGNMRILGPNTIGLVNLTDKIVLSASGALEMEDFPIGNIGVVSQSGGILGSLLSRAAARGIGMSKLISTSNEVDLEMSDFIDYLVNDPATKVIALYIETVRNPYKFRLACLRAARIGKPVVAFKIGRSQAGARAAVSHTGALAGTDSMYDALFHQVGVIRAQTFTDLLDMSVALATGRRLRGKRIAVLTSTGGVGTLISDDLGIANFDTPSPDENTANTLRALNAGLQEAVLDRNPIDVTLAGLKPDLLRGAIQALLASPTYDGLVVVVGSSAIAMPELMAKAVEDCLPNSDKPVLAYVSPYAPAVAQILTRRGVPAFVAAESCSAAFGALRYMHNMQSMNNFIPLPPILKAPAALDTSDLPTGQLDEAKAKQLFARYGIPITKEFIVTSAEQALAATKELGGRVVLKILSSEILHKSDVGGVKVDLNIETIESSIDSMKSQVQSLTGIVPQKFLIQEMVTDGVELVLGMRRDPLGIGILLGMGGVASQLYMDTALRLLPFSGGLSKKDALAMAQELKTWPLLDGFRGAPKADVDALVDAIVSFSEMSAQLGDRLVEAEINPIFVLEQGKGVKAADAIAVISQ